MWHKLCRTFHPWCLCIKTRCLLDMSLLMLELKLIHVSKREPCHHHLVLIIIMTGVFITTVAIWRTILLSFVFLYGNYRIFGLIWHWKFFSQDPINKYSNTGSGNGLAPDRREAIIWTNDNLVYWRTYASLSRDELKAQPVSQVCTCKWEGNNVSDLATSIR